jgi:cyclophilin family peptidyl-prolyl cis-trans isomerase
MSRKREQIDRRRRLSKARKGARRSPRARPGKPSARRRDQKTEMLDVWLAVGIVAVIVAAFLGLYYFTVLRPARSPSPPKEAEEVSSGTEPLSWTEPPEMTLDLSKSYEALIRTEKGDVRVELFDDGAPITVNNFSFLARQGFYDGVTFHRVIPGFMAQTGDPTGTGSGGPGYTFEDEFDPSLRHDAEGILSMANRGPGTNGSQFFITLAPQPHLDDHHTVFGKVVEGMDVVTALTPRTPSEQPDAPPGDKILSIEIIES